MVELNIEIFGEQIISRRLMRLGERVIDATPAFAQIAVMFYESEKKQFDSEGEWASGGWVPLKQSTIDEKLRSSWFSGTSELILQRTGALKRSLTEPGAPFSKKLIGPDFVDIKSTVPYGPLLQKGTSKMPMRKPVELNEPTKMAMVKVLQAWVLGGEGGSDTDVVI
jgi:hypothetical protein